MTFLYDNLENPRTIVVLGTAYTPDRCDASPTVNVLKTKHMNLDLVDKTKDLPVFIEHDDKYPIGKVVKTFLDEKRNLNAFLEISGNKLVNSKLPATLEIDPHTNQRYYSGISMGTDVLLDETSKCYTHVKEVRPKELSIVKTPDRPNALIRNHWLVPRDQDVHEFVQKQCENLNLIEFDYK